MKYLTLLLCTDAMLQANARGESDGTSQTLQTIGKGGRLHTVVSGYSIRYAIRAALEDSGFPVWRHHDTTGSNSGYGYLDADGELSESMYEAAPEDRYAFVDTSLFGFMITPKKAKLKDSDTKGKGTALKQRSAVSMGPAVSLTPYAGDQAFVRGLKEDGGTNPFSTDRHYTRYEWHMCIDLGMLQQNPDAVKALFTVLTYLQVGGSHAANASEWGLAGLAYRFHNRPGQGGLGVGFDAMDDPTAAPTLEALTNKARDRGIEFSAGGLELTETPLIDTLEILWSQVQDAIGVKSKTPLREAAQAAK
jgi:CRISPR-associated autoregulator DevR family